MKWQKYIDAGESDHRQEAISKNRDHCSQSCSIHRHQSEQSVHGYASKYSNAVDVAEVYFAAEQEEAAERQAEDERTGHVRVLKYGLFGGPEGIQDRQRLLDDVFRVDPQLLQQGWLIIKITWRRSLENNKIKLFAFEQKGSENWGYLNLVKEPMNPTLKMIHH